MTYFYIIAFLVLGPFNNSLVDYVALGGVSQLFRLLQPPLVPPDARSISESQVKGRQDIWNEVLVLLREICFATPHLADRVATRTHIIFLFTMLQHTCVFENSMNLLEEILAVRNEAFSLADIPKFYEMVEKFTTRQLAVSFKSFVSRHLFYCLLICFFLFFLSLSYPIYSTSVAYSL